MGPTEEKKKRPKKAQVEEEIVDDGDEDSLTSTQKKPKKDTVQISKRIWLPVNTEKVPNEFIPKDVLFLENKKVLEQVAICVGKNFPLLLIGETGTGKTSIVRHVAHKTKNGFVRVNHNGGTTIEDIVGRWLIDGSGKTVWVDGLLVLAAKNGWWYHADEINAAGADINFIYHSLLDDDGYIVLAEKGNEVIIPHKNFRFFAAMNPPAEYAGTKELNKALMSRFMVINVDFPSPEVEEKILVERTGISPEVAKNMVRNAGEVRITHAQEQSHFVFSTRDLIYWAELFMVYKRYMISAEMAVLNKASKEDVEGIRDNMILNLEPLDKEAARKSKKNVKGGTKAQSEPAQAIDEDIPF